MDLEKITWIFKNDKTIKLVKADYAPLIICFFKSFFQNQNQSISQKELVNGLSDFLFQIDADKEAYPLNSKQYIDKWVGDGYLFRKFEITDEPLYELTPATINAFKWLDEISKEKPLGTESRLLDLFNKLREIVRKTTENIEDRIKDLETQKQNIEKEIEDAKLGKLKLFDDREIKENFLNIEDLSKRLLYDFKHVEYNFKEIDKSLRQKVIKSNLSKGKLLDDVFGQQDYLMKTEEGRSFKAFWDFLLTYEKQQEFDKLIKHVLELPQIKSMPESKTIQKIKFNLIEAGEKVNKNNDSLIEQLRRFLEQKSFIESKRILNGIEQIEEFVLSNYENLDNSDFHSEIDDIIDLSFIMDKPLFKPPVKIKFDMKELEEGLAHEMDKKLFNQFYIDKELLKENINYFLKTKSQVSLTEILEKFEVKYGVSELIAYLEIASKNKKHMIDNALKQEIQIKNQNSDKEYKISLPLVIFNK